MILPWDKLVRLAMAGYNDLLSRFFGELESLDRYPDPLGAISSDVNELGVDFATLLADLGMASELNGMADPLLTVTMDDLPILRSWRRDFYAQLERYPRTYLWDGIAFPSETPAWRPVTEKAVKALKTWKIEKREDFDRLARQEKSRAWTITGINSKKTLSKLRSSLADVIQTGASRVNWYKSVKKDFDKSRLGPAAAELVFRVASTKAWHEGQAKIVQNDRIGQLFPYVRVITINDARRTVACAMMSRNGLDNTGVYNRLDPAYIHNRTPRHYNCFLPDTVIQGRVQKALKSFYSGKVVEIVTGSGNKLTVTANHPIAISGSFVPAHELRKGVNLLSYRGGIKEGANLFGSFIPNSSSQVGTLSVPSANEQNPPAMIKDIFSSLSNLGGMFRFPSAPFHLHGDGACVDGEIQEVSANRILPIKNISGLLQQQIDRFLAFLRMRLLGKIDAGAMLHLGFAGDAPSDGIMGSFGLPLPLDVAHERPLDFLRFGLASEIDASRTEVEGDYLTTDPKFFAQLVHRSSGAIFLDEIAEIRQYDFSEHVYDSQTEGGWLVANNIIASNCRCRDSFMTVAQAARYGITEAKEWQRTGKRPDKFQFVPYFEVPMPEGWIPLNTKVAA